MPRVLIDLQTLQSETSESGIAEDLRELVTELVSTSHDWDFEFLLNGSKELVFAAAFEFVRSVEPEAKVHIWHPPQSESDNFHRLAEISLETLYLKVNPDVVLLAKNFEDYSEQIFTRISSQLRTAVLLPSAKLGISWGAGLGSSLPTTGEDQIGKSVIGFEPHSTELEATNRWSKLADGLKSAVAESTHMPAKTIGQSKPTLAFFSPMPPAKTGIANYSNQLLPELAKFYQITVIDSASNSRAQNASGFAVESGTWFSQNANMFDRIVYQIGNSGWHHEAIDFLVSNPGVSVIHDYFLGGYYSNPHFSNSNHEVWQEALLASHGYFPIPKTMDSTLAQELASEYPSNLVVQQNSLATLFHSQTALDLNQIWTSSSKSARLASKLPLIPTVSKSTRQFDVQALTAEFGIEPEDFVIASFGFTAENKGHLDIVNAMAKVRATYNGRIFCVFVGADSSESFGTEIRELVQERSLEGIVVITGWVSSDDYKGWLTRANLVIQLRKTLRGESSGPLLDALSYGKPVITTRGLAAKSVGDFLKVLEPTFSDSALSEAIIWYLSQPSDLGPIKCGALEYIDQNHSPALLADLYFQKIEDAYQSADAKVYSALRSSDLASFTSEELGSLAKSLADSIVPSPRVRQIFVDVSAFAMKNEGTGVHRVVERIASELLHLDRPGSLVVPVYFNSEIGKYSPADNTTRALLRIRQDSPSYGEYIQPWPGDYFLGLDLSFEALDAKSEELLRFRAKGVKVGSVLYDILPLEHPEFFWQGFNETFEAWLRFISCFDDVLCISQTTAKKYEAWRSRNAASSRSEVLVFSMGSDFKESRDNEPQIMRQPNSFLMVGTIEPRKGHLETVKTFEKLWGLGYEANLTIVGKDGWLNRDVVRYLKSNKFFKTRLVWHKKLNDANLEQLYRQSTALIAASYAEGYGLPIVEAGLKNLPVIARDIEVFREVAGPNTVFFNDNVEANLLAKLRGIIEGKISLDFEEDAFAKPLTWAEAAESLATLISRGTSSDQ